MTNTASGSVYKIKKRQVRQLKLYSDLQCITEAERCFLLELISLAAIKFEQIDEEIQTIDITRPEFKKWLDEKNEEIDVEVAKEEDEKIKKIIKKKKIGASETLIKKRSASFTTMGLFVKDKFRRENFKPSDLFLLQDPTNVAHLDAVEKKFKDHRTQRIRLKEIKSSLVEADAQILDSQLNVRLARSERLWNGVFGSCMCSSRNDPRKNESFSTIYSFGADKIEIITSSQTDSQICNVDDQRTIRAVITLACIATAERIQFGQNIINEFFVDIVDLCKIMGLDGSGANRDTVRDSMKRLYSTNFNIVMDSDSEAGARFADQFGITPGADDLNFRFLTELDASIDREYGGGSVRRPRWYRISFHSKTFQDLIDPNVISTFIDNKEILKVSSGLIHVFYTWCSIHVKRRGSRVLTVSLPDLQKQLIPATRYDNFRERFLVALRRQQLNSNENWIERGVNIVKLFGYIIKMEPDPSYDYIFTVHRDKKDPIIGDGSIHNRLSNTKQASISEAVKEI